MEESKKIYDSKPSSQELAKVIRELRDDNRNLKLQVIKYEEVLRENGIEDSPTMSDAEAICVNEINRLKDLSVQSSGLTFEDTKILDILHKNLLLARGREIKPSSKDKKLSTDELLSIVNGGKK